MFEEVAVREAQFVVNIKPEAWVRIDDNIFLKSSVADFCDSKVALSSSRRVIGIRWISTSWSMMVPVSSPETRPPNEIELILVCPYTFVNVLHLNGVLYPVIDIGDSV